MQPFLLADCGNFDTISHIDELRAVNRLYVDDERNKKMKRFFTLEYWEDDSWFVGKLKEIPGVFSQGKTIEELKENILDAYRMMLQESDVEDEHPDVKYIELGVEV